MAIMRAILFPAVDLAVAGAEDHVPEKAIFSAAGGVLDHAITPTLGR